MAQEPFTPEELERFETLARIVARLRAPDGCPWDRQQTHASLRPNLLEECYEALEAIDRGDPARLKEEMGDLLIQIAFHCQIAQEVGEFTWADLFRQVNEKLVRRHPHIFGSGRLTTPREVEEQWETLKRRERPTGSLLDGVPPTMPALAYAQAISHRAARAGFEWEDLDGVLEKVAEELQELRRARDPEERERELGDLLFTLVNVARWLGVDAESALRRASRRFYRRFTRMEEEARRKGRDLASLPAEEKEALWARAKEMEGPTP